VKKSRRRAARAIGYFKLSKSQEQNEALGCKDTRGLGVWGRGTKVNYHIEEGWGLTKTEQVHAKGEESSPILKRSSKERGPEKAYLWGQGERKGDGVPVDHSKRKSEGNSS